MADCPNLKANQARCACTYDACERRGKCCECVQYHAQSGSLPACLRAVGDK